MQRLRSIGWTVGLTVALIAVSGALAPPAGAAVTPHAAPPAQLFGPPGWASGFYFGPEFTGPPYVGSPAYPYYRYGAGYGSAFGPSYSTYRGLGAYYGGSAGSLYPSYSSAGGVMFGDTWGSGYYPTVGRCLYGASAGYGGGWTDPSSYGYYAPFC